MTRQKQIRLFAAPAFAGAAKNGGFALCVPYSGKSKRLRCAWEIRSLFADEATCKREWEAHNSAGKAWVDLTHERVVIVTGNEQRKRDPLKVKVGRLEPYTLEIDGGRKVAIAARRVCEDFLVHRVIDRDGYEGSLWSLTHAASGLAAGKYCSTRRNAITIAVLLSTLFPKVWAEHDPLSKLSEVDVRFCGWLVRQSADEMRALADLLL